MTNAFFDCTGKVAVVVGGAGLIGKEIVNGLSSFGATVFVADERFRKARRLATKTYIEEIPFNIKKPHLIKSALAKIKKQAGRLDILVNCAYPRTKDWGTRCENVTPFSWKSNLDAHLGGYFFSSRAAAELMKTQKSGVIINFASIYGLVAPDFGLYKGTPMTMPVAYSAIKGGIIAFTKYLATYYASDGVRANIISPGGVKDAQHPSFEKRYSQKTPLQRMATPRDVVGAVIFLASDAASYVTGANIVVDGGWTVW